MKDGASAFSSTGTWTTQRVHAATGYVHDPLNTCYLSIRHNIYILITGVYFLLSLKQGETILAKSSWVGCRVFDELTLLLWWVRGVFDGPFILQS